MINNDIFFLKKDILDGRHGVNKDIFFLKKDILNGRHRMRLSG